MNAKNLCKLCKEEIKDDAKVCIHCGSLQNWKRYLNFSSLILSLVIAAFTVFGFTYPYLKEKLQPLKTQLSATIMGTSKEYLYLFVSNTGNRAGSIKDVFFTDFAVSKKLNRRSHDFFAQSLKEFKVIQPGQSQIIKLDIKNAPMVFPEYLDDPKLNEFKSVCRLRIDAVAFDGSTIEEIDIFYACIPHDLKDQWMKEKALTRIVKKQVDIDKALKNHPELLKLIEEYEPQLDDFFEDHQDIFAPQQ